MLFKQFCFWVSFLMSLSTVAQPILPRLPQIWGQSDQVLLLFQPSTTSSDKANVGVGLNQMIGAFDNIKSYYFLAQYQLNNEDKFWHKIGIQALSDREGSFIRENRMYVSYSSHIPLNETIRMGLGIGIGLVGLSFIGNDVSPGGNATKPDIQFSSTIQSDRTKIGLSINQLLQPKITPIVATYKLQRYASFFVQHQFDLSLNAAVRPFAFVRYSGTNQFETSLQSSFLIYQKLAFAIGAKNFSSFLGGVTFENIPILDQNCSFFFNYQWPVSKLRSASVFELGLSFRFKPTENE